MNVLCNVDHLEAEYVMQPQGACTITFRSQGRKLDVKDVQTGEGSIQYSYSTHTAGKNTNRVWHADPSLKTKSIVPFTPKESGT